MYQVGSGLEAERLAERPREGLPVAQESHAQTPWGRAQAVPKLPEYLIPGTTFSRRFFPSHVPLPHFPTSN